jgi:ubiquinone/menaquinone biosynthesis C-methylase UbiE
MKIAANNRLIADPQPRDMAKGAPPVLPAESANAFIPPYMREVYHWAYLDSGNARFLDQDLVVGAILLGNNARLKRALISEIHGGQSVLQAAHVYGGLIPEIANRVGSTGSLDVIDLVPLQANLCRQKLRDYPQARVRIANANDPGDDTYDAVSCFFLLHEIPDELKFSVVDALLQRLKPSGKAIFVDYHKPAKWHPLRGLLRLIFNRLEPFAESLWQREIADYASAAESYRWETQTFFGGLYQKTVAYRI